MNKSYQDWESQFLNDMVIKFCFSGNDETAFKYRLLLCYSDFNDQQLADEIKGYFRVKGDIPSAPNVTLRDCWVKIYAVLKKHGFDYKDKNNNPNGKYEKSWEGVRKWLLEEIFHEYIKKIQSQTSIELWQELWEKSEDNSNISIEESSSKNDIPHLGVAVIGVFEPNLQPDWPSFRIGSQIMYQLKLNNPGYLIVAEKFASGEIYCLAPSKLSSAFPVPWGRLVLPKNDVFTVQPPMGYEEILAVFSQDQPQLNWLPQAEDDPLELQTEHLADLLNHINQNKCEVMRYKYLITS
ncbi:DUF4384 domain-containing protein [Microcoleus sp. C2C3]|uniref:DUF4384 domain-containing protein n=1 Tax=unclassified Microcoleus TaxID=2642155 RepID=UPI002FD3E068